MIENHKKYFVQKRTQRSIPSLGVLKKTLSITDTEITLFYNLINNNNAYSRVYGSYKSTGEERKVYNPHSLIRKIQRRINQRIFNPAKPKEGLIIWPFYLYGSIPNVYSYNQGLLEKHSKDYISCAQNHCLRSSILKIDISDFYENIHHSDVYRIFNEVLGYPSDVSILLSDFCCFEDKIPQGGLTSSFIASAALHDVEPELVKKLQKKKLIYTRLVDDITVSSDNRNYDFSLAISLIKNMLISKGLPINEKKLFISQHSSSTTLVHGLRVNFKEPRLPENEISKIRASVKGLEKLAEDSVYRVSRDYRKSHAKCLGRVNRMQRIGHNQARGLLVRILRILPKPSYQDRFIVKKMVYKLEKMTDRDSYTYRKLYYKTQMELNILKRGYRPLAIYLRKRIREMKPSEY